jgi:hypothetical protein
MLELPAKWANRKSLSAKDLCRAGQSTLSFCAEEMGHDTEEMSWVHTCMQYSDFVHFRLSAVLRPACLGTLDTSMCLEKQHFTMLTRPACDPRGNAFA